MTNPIAKPPTTDEPLTASSNSVARSDDPQDLRLNSAIETFLEQCETGQPPDVESFIAAHPDIADQLRECLAGLLFLQQTGASLDSDGALPTSRTSQPLGDFRIIRQIGRGGMGIVYEAEQLSLGRRVALKVLPLAATLDPRHLQRFRNEALAVGLLDHPHIVDVYGVGCERGVHYYAMRYIEGHTLAQAGDWRPEAGGKKAENRPSDSSSVISSDLQPPASSLPPTLPIAAASTVRTTNPRESFRRIAEIGAQAASALEHAHQAGIIHRDIKPSNMMLDERGKLWITDFGLARIESSAGITMSGDLIGTLRYMSPEQAAGKSATVSHRTDIYSLGTTLYELLTRRPAFPAEDRQTLLHDILHTEPIPPHKINNSIPPDLRTIVLKAMAKEPHDRYSTAQELADDLRRFLEDRPIQARPLRRLARTWRWCRRSPAMASLAAVIFGLSLLISVAAPLVAVREVKHRKLAVAESREARWQQYLSDMHAAMAAWDESDLERTIELLDRHVPRPGMPDHRGFEWYYLWRETHHPMMGPVLRQESRVGCLAVSPDGNRLAVGTDDGRIAIWNLTSLRREKTLVGNPNWVYGLSFFPDNLTLASGGTDRLSRIWNSATGALLGTQRHPQGVVGVAVSSDGSRIATACWDGFIRVWEYPSGALLHQLESGGTSETIFSSVGFSPTEPVLAAGCADGTFRLWNLTSGQPLFTLSGHPPAYSIRLAFSPDGRTIATSSGAVMLWNSADGKLRKTFAGDNDIADLAFSPDGASLATVSRAGAIQTWDVGTGDLKRVLGGHGGTIMGIAWLPSGRQLVTGGAENFRLWNMDAPVPSEILSSHNIIGPLAISPDGTVVASGSQTVFLWEIASGSLIDKIELGTDTIVLQFCPVDGNLLAIGLTGGKVRLWNRATKESRFFDGHDSDVIALSWSPDGLHLATGSADPRAVVIWDVPSGRKVHELVGHGSRICSLAHSPDGRLLVSRSEDNTLRIWDATTGALRRTIAEKAYFYCPTVFSSDGRLLASGGDANTVKIWSVDDWRVLRTLHGHRDRVVCLDFSRDGRALAAADSEGPIRLWDVATGQERFRLKPAEGESAKFTPDGRTLITAELNGRVRVWRTAEPGRGPPP